MKGQPRAVLLFIKIIIMKIINSLFTLGEKVVKLTPVIVTSNIFKKSVTQRSDYKRSSCIWV